MKTGLLIRIMLVCFVVFSCEKDKIKPDEYGWVSSEVIPYFGAIHKIKVADGNSLYMAGIIDGTVGIFKLENKKWIKLVDTSDIGFAKDFCIYNGVLYYGSYYGLYRVIDSKPEKFTNNTPHIRAMEVYNDKLFITGDSISVGSNYYSLASYNGSDFSAISKHFGGYTMNVLNNKLYLSSSPVIQLEENEGQYLNNFGGQSNIIEGMNGDLFVSLQGWHKEEYISIIQKYSNEMGYLLGDTINASIHNVQAFNNTVIATGFENNNGVSYFFTDNGWKEIDMPVRIGEVIKYENKILGIPLHSGTAYELQLK